MKITCDTDIGELIKVSDITGPFGELSSDIKSILVYSKVLKKETLNGRGLSKEALRINGHSDANRRAIRQLGNLEDFYSSYDSTKSQLIDAAKTQRKKELMDLRNAVEAKIEELNSSINSLNRLLNPGFKEPILTPSQKDSYKFQLQARRASLARYKEKLQQVESELGKV